MYVAKGNGRPNPKFYNSNNIMTHATTKTHEIREIATDIIYLYTQEVGEASLSHSPRRAELQSLSRCLVALDLYT